jgi:hypothetical protein
MRRTVVAMLVVAIALDAAYWSIWFTQRDWLASEHTQAYYDFENAFPLADLWLGIACMLALVTLVRRRASALLWLIAKGGGGAVEAVIVAVTWIFAITVLRFAWTRRGDLLGSES